MRTVDIDDDVFQALEVVSNFNKIPLSQLLREIVMERIQPKPGAASIRNATMQQPPQRVQLSPHDKAVRDYVQSPNFLASRSVMDQFLNILSFLHSENVSSFAILESMEGRKRKYIAKNEQELENSGASVNAKKIPNTSYWAVTNNSTESKKLLLKQALTLLGYNSETSRLVPQNLR
jgi:negative modulator of initiation of replication